MEATRRPRRRPGENRVRLLEAGLIEFGLFGYHGASTTAIARRAGVPQPHVYANFATKPSLFLRCAEEYLTVDGIDSSHADALRLLVQAIAAAREPSLAAELVPLLARLRRDLGPARFDASVARGAALLIS